MRKVLAESINEHLRAKRISSDVLNLRVDVYAEKHLHLLEWCKTKSGTTLQKVTVEELLRNGCSKCCHEYNLDAHGGGTSPVKMQLSKILDAAREMEKVQGTIEERYQKAPRGQRESTALRDAQSAVAMVATLRGRDVPAEVLEEKERLLKLAPGFAQKKIAAVKDEQRIAELRREAQRWYPEGNDCLLGLPRWWYGYFKGRAADALELLVAFSTEHPDPELMLSRVPGWATGFIIEQLGDREELEMAEDVHLTAAEQEVLCALWPGMVLLEAIETAQVLAV